MELTSVESTHRFVVDDRTGLPTALIVDRGGVLHRASIEATLDVEIGGTEQRCPTGGIEYRNTERFLDVVRTGDTRLIETPLGPSWRVPVTVGTIVGDLVYCMNRVGPACSVRFHFRGEQQAVVRNVSLRVRVGLERGHWTVTAPGNGLASATPLEQITDSVGISPIGGLRGSSGLVHLEPDSETQPAMCVWFDSDVEIPEIELLGISSCAIQVDLRTNFAADLTNTAGNEVQLLSFDLGVASWSSFPPLFAAWLRARALTSPGAPPAWIPGGMIYEAQVGFSVFSETNRYSPYGEIDELTNDLDRIAALGFTVVQLMPRQPYPSYNVHDYWDIDISYGPKTMLIELVQQCHARGLRIILDVLLHGVLDQESIAAAADGVRGGPFAELVKCETGDSFAGDVKDIDHYLIAWSRHILDFEPYWRAGSPVVSPLIAQHPEWFARDSAGNVAGVYTKAFDARNREWQAYFTDAMVFLMSELGVDGFRFDAPTYNHFPNWAGWARSRASSSALGCVGLFERLRPVMKSLQPDSLMYTEPSGHALRKSMDLNYNYDEQWLVSAITDPSEVKPWMVKDTKALACWMRDRDALLPQGSITAHHIDSHDTFWWPTWGKKWRREQFTREQFRMLTVIFGSLPGPFMMFAGGEEGIEDVLPLLGSLKARREWTDGSASWWTGPSVPDAVFGLTRSLGSASTTVLCNFSAPPVIVPAAHLTTPRMLFTVNRDSTLTGPANPADSQITFSTSSIVLGGYTSVAYSDASGVAK